MDHVQLIKINNLTLPQKHMFRQWAGLLNSTNGIILMYYSDINDIEYDRIYSRLMKKNKGLVTFSRIKVPKNDLKLVEFLDVTTVPTFVFYQKRRKLVQLNGHSITQNNLQSYINNILYHKHNLGIPEL